IVHLSSLSLEAPDPEGAGDECGQHDRRLQEEGDYVVGELTFIFEAVDAEDGCDEGDEPVGPSGQGDDDGESCESARAVAQELKAPRRGDEPEAAEERIQVRGARKLWRQDGIADAELLGDGGRQPEARDHAKRKEKRARKREPPAYLICFNHKHKWSEPPAVAGGA